MKQLRIILGNIRYLILMLVGRANPILAARIKYFSTFFKPLNLKNPRTLNEKINWLKFNTDTTEWVRLADKYAVRDYIKECGYEEYLIPLYGKWDDAKDIDFDTLPESFIIKPNNGSGEFKIIKDKESCDLEGLRSNLNRWMQTSCDIDSGTIYYSQIKPCIIAEKLLFLDDVDRKYSSSIIDYKIWCMNGEPRCVLVVTNRVGHNADLLTYDLDWRVIDGASIKTFRHNVGAEIEKPKRLDEMIDLARTLSAPFPCVRIDLYHNEDKIYFGEMTFTSAAGMMNYFSSDFLLKLGDMVDVNYPVSTTGVD